MEDDKDLTEHHCDPKLYFSLWKQTRVHEATKQTILLHRSKYFKKIEWQNLQIFKIYAKNISYATNVHMVHRINIPLSRKCALEISFAYKTP